VGKIVKEKKAEKWGIGKMSYASYGENEVKRGSLLG